jgi:radical SAM superfamily enzyme YgiQ (UPF0313 family)
VLAPANFEPLALEVLAALIPEHDVQVFDMRYESFHSLNHKLHSFRPEITGVTCNNTIHVIQAINLLNFVRANFPSSVILLGGHHPTIIPEDFYLHSVDYIFLGWAEKSFPQFIKSFSNLEPTDSIPGMITLKQAIPVNRTENPFDLKAGEIHFPDRNSTRKYWRYYRNEVKFRTALVSTARGCPFRCSFCSVWKANKGHFLIRPAEDVSRELSSLPSNIKRIFFADDNTFIDTKNAGRLCEMIRESGIKRKYSGYCRSDTVIRHPELMRSWREIGLDNLCVGFEGIDEEGLKKVNKSNKESINIDASRILHQAGVPFRSYLLIDPDFEQKDFDRIFLYVKEHHLVNPVFTIMTPLPGTDYYDQVKDRINLSYDYFDFMHAVIPTRMEVKEFYMSTIRLFMDSYSFKRHLGLRLLKLKYLLAGRHKENSQLQVMPVSRLLLLKILSIFMKRKLYRHIASINGQRSAVSSSI